MNKAVITLLFLPLFSFISNAQTLNFGSDSIKCRQNYSLMIEYLKQKQYNDAALFWMKMQDYCPKFSDKYYHHGKNIYRNRIKVAPEGNNKEQLIDTLMLIHEWHMKHFGRTPENMRGFGNEYLRYRQNDPNKAFELFKELIDGENAKPGFGIYIGYFQSVYLMEIRKQIDNKQLIEEYLKVIERIKKALQIAHENDKKELIKAKQVIDDLFKKRLTCKGLFDVLREKWENAPLEEKPKTELAQFLLELINEHKCVDDPLPDELAKYIHGVAPNHSSAFAIGVRAFQQKDYRTALSYFEQAIQLCENCQEFDYYFKAAKAALNNGQNFKAFKYAKQASKLQPKNGDVYLLIAKAVARSFSDCGDRDIIKRSVYWLAVDYLEKAKAVDTSLHNEANKLIEQYKKQFPEAKELFFHGLKEGEKYTVPCFGEETIIRARP